MSKTSEFDALDTESSFSLDYETDFDLDLVVPYSDGAGSQGTVATSRGKYYFEDGDLYIQVENVLFRVYKHFLSPSAISNTVAESTNDGSSERTPIPISQITQEDFEDLLWVFYDESIQREAPPKKWLSILRTAERLEIKRVQELAVAKLTIPGLSFSDVDPIAHIATQQRYGIDMEWADASFEKIGVRAEPLTEEEAIAIGSFATVTIAYWRERRHDYAAADEWCGYSGYFSDSRWPPYGRDSYRRELPDVCEPALYSLPVHEGKFYVTAEGHRFCVHPHFLTQYSPIIRAMLATRTSQDGDLPLPGIQSRHFSWLLQLFYDESFHLKATPTQLAAIRRIAGQYKMDTIIELTTKRMQDTMTAVEQIKAIDLHSIQDEHSTGPWIAVCLRRKPLNAEEGEQLGPQLCARIAKDRECCAWDQYNNDHTLHLPLYHHCAETK